jgi:hypothetical protein
MGWGRITEQKKEALSVVMAVAKETKKNKNLAYTIWNTSTAF